MNRIALTLMLVVSLAAGFSDARAGDSYPPAPVHIIVPFPAGGVADVHADVATGSRTILNDDSLSPLGRQLGTDDARQCIGGAKLSAKWGQAVIVENHPGAGGQHRHGHRRRRLLETAR